MSKPNQYKQSLGSSSEYFHVIFEFNDIKKSEEVNRAIFHSSIGNIDRQLIDEKIIIDNLLIYHVKINDHEKFQITFPYEITKFKSQYQKILKKIRIEKHNDSDINEEKLNWKQIKDFFSKGENYLFPDDLLSVIFHFTKSMDYVLLETYITNIILFHSDPTEREKYIDSLNLEKPYTSLKKLFGATSFVSQKDIERIIDFIKTDDFLIKKAIFTYIHKKDNSIDITHYFKMYQNCKGKEIFTERELRDFNNSLTTWDVFFELFFKQYYGISLKEKIEGFDDLEKVEKIEIPINPNAYDLSIYSDDTKDIIRNKFHTDLKFILNSCKRVIYHESKRILNKRLENIIVCFDYAKSEEYITELKALDIYFNISQKLIHSKIGLCNHLLKTHDKDDTPEFRFYCIFKGNYVELKDASIIWEKQFGIKDFNEDTITCKIKKHKSYFNQFELFLEIPIIVQSFLYIKFRMRNKKWTIISDEIYLDIIDLAVLEEFKPISITLGKNRYGVIKLENTPKGLRKYRYAKKGEPSYNIILHRPINLINVYKGENELFYEIMIGKEKVCKTKPDLCNWIENETNYASKSGKELKEAISNVLFAYMKEKNLIPLPMFHTAGVFLKDDNFVVVHPFKEGLTVIGENDIQHEYIERIKEKGIDFEGQLCKSYYDILQIEGIREDIRVGIYGFASIHPFFYALSKAIDIFPNLFMIGIHGSGKTTVTETLFNYLFGTKIRSPDSIDSPARITKYSTESTFSLNIDDIDILEEKLMNFIKVNSTRKGTRDRLTRENKLNSEQTYTSYVGSANNRNFLAGNENDAFRKRCLIFETMKGIDITEDTTNFESVRFDIAEGKIFGFYLLEKAIEFIEKLSDKSISTCFKLITHINEIRRKIKKKVIEKVIPLSDRRRLMVYALIYIGWEIWNYTFKITKLESLILEKYLDMDQEYLWEFIKNLEETEKDITITTFDSILQYFEENRNKFNHRKTPKGKILLLSDFIVQYDKFARQRGYDILKDLVELVNLQSKILGFDIKPKTTYFRNSIDNTTDSKHGCLFYYDEICKERHKKIEDSLTDEEKRKILNIISKVREIFRENKKEVLDVENLHQVLEVYFEDKDFVYDAMDYLFNENILQLDEIDEEKCRFNDPEDVQYLTLNDQDGLH